LPASWLQSFDFGCFSSQHFTCLIVTTISRHSHGTLRVSWMANFCVFSRDLFRDSRRNDLIEAWGVARLLPLTGHTRCGSRAPMCWWVPCWETHGHGRYPTPCRRDMRPVSENMTSRGSKRPPFFPRNYTREMISQPMTGKSHFQEVYRW
jgi:hypothetical protein